MRRMIPILAVILVVAAAWIAWPFWTAHRIVRAVEQQDTASLTPLVDWQQLRGGLKDDLTQRAQAEIARGGQGSALGSSLGNLLVPALVDMAVSNLVTPASITELVRLGRSGSQLLRQAGGRSNGGSQDDGRRDDGNKDRKLTLSHAWFTSPTRFRFDLVRTDKKDEPGTQLILAFKDFGWQLVRLHLP